MISQLMRALVFIGTCVAPAIAVAPSAHAENPFDGRWDVVLVTKSGPCQAVYRAGVQVSNGIVRLLGDTENRASGRVSPSGHVVVTASLGPLSGMATGRLSGNSGAGTWRAHVQEGSCSGEWTVQRQ